MFCWKYNLLNSINESFNTIKYEVWVQYVFFYIFRACFFDLWVAWLKGVIECPFSTSWYDSLESL